MKALLSSPITLVVLAVLIAVFGFGVVRQVQQLQKAQADVAELEQHLASIQQRNEEAREDLEGLEDDERIEQEARARLNLKKQGEHVVIIIPGDEDPEGASAEDTDSISTPSVEHEEAGIWQRLTGWVGDLF